MSREKEVWVTNQRVAWQVPIGRIANFYRAGSYLPPPGWSVIEGSLVDWLVGALGERRHPGEA